MATGIDTLISPAMVEAKGRWSEVRVSPPISPSDIRRWAIATYWPQTPPPLYWDEAYAQTTRWGAIIAPPDFNPFAWPVRRTPPPAAAPPAGGVRLTAMNGGQTDSFGVPMRAGDVIFARSRLSDFNERQGRFGLMLYSYTEILWTNQNDEFVRRRIATSIRY
ncbi:MAG TPA: MaoC family dehydratase N-terminal domain-containing protein [Caulobacteraceae bacterium]|nr:MaoC family dehydratase N-terminal domain-containing protein [Caulobacteraceae bacterium]